MNTVMGEPEKKKTKPYDPMYHERQAYKKREAALKNKTGEYYDDGDFVRDRSGRIQGSWIDGRFEPD